MQRPGSRASIAADNRDSRIKTAVGASPLSGTFLAATFTGHFTASGWSIDHSDEFRRAVTWGGTALTAPAAGLVAFGMPRSAQIARRLKRRELRAPLRQLNRRCPQLRG